MEERYEIRGKIGQVGICPVYRAFDIRLGREVAIKRILSRFDDSKEREDCNKQIVAETNAIASLQHPHIVRIFDLGMDGAVPYVVTELITGRRLDEIIASAPLTWPDFREFAIQTQEALIAAQEFNMIHSELKPSNIMVTWLASGKFQVKVMDFGLAALYRSQTTNGTEVNEFDFDSMFFMAPEQFESKPLDARSDLYSMGCVYYYALTGTYPYTGISSSELISAHLQHAVIPIQDLRKGIPIWVCDWVMWLINCNPQDRPETARDALKNFIKNDSHTEPELSLGSLKSRRPSLSIPGASTSLISIPPQIIEPKSLDHWRPGFDEVEVVSQPMDTSKNASTKLSTPRHGYNPNASSVPNHDRLIPKPVKTKYAYSPTGPAHEMKIPTGKMSIAAIAGFVSAVVFILAMAAWMLRNNGEKRLLDDTSIVSNGTEKSGTGAVLPVNVVTTGTSGASADPVVDVRPDQRVVAAAAGQTPWTPAQFACEAWYDAADASTITASGNAVSQWNDKKGTRHFTQKKAANKPAYVGNSYLQFDGTNDFMTTTGIGSANVSVFGVVQVDTDNSNTDVGKAWLTELIGRENPDWSMNGLTSVDSLASLNIDSAGSARSFSAAASRDTMHLQAMTTFTSSSNGLVRVDGGSYEGGLATSGNNLQTGKKRILHLGCQKYKVATRYHKGRVYEILILNKRLLPTDADYLRIEGYLAHKWGLATNLPTDHPYKNAAP